MPMPYVPEFAGREVFCLGCGSHFVIPDLHQTPKCGDPQYRIVKIDSNPPDSGHPDSPNT